VLAPERHDVIIEAVRRLGSVRVRDLAERLDVSEMTIRRDLDHLAALSLVEKVHGGATRVGDLSSFEPGFSAKQHRQREEKSAIARRALDLVNPGSAIGLTAGTTTWAFAKLLTTVPELTVVTNAPSIAQALYHLSRPDLTVVLTGGVRTPSDALVGPVATGSLSKLHLDTVFMGVHGMDEQMGFTTPNVAEAEVNGTFIRSCRRLVVLADHTKWGTVGLAQIAPLQRADVVVSDVKLPAEAVRAFDNLDTRLHLVDTD